MNVKFLITPYVGPRGMNTFIRAETGFTISSHALTIITFLKIVHYQQQQNSAIIKMYGNKVEDGTQNVKMISDVLADREQVFQQRKTCTLKL